MADELRHRATNQGLTAKVIGDGKGEITKEMIQGARARGLIGPDTHVICLLHGGTKRVKGREGKSHVLHTGFAASTSNESGKERKKLTSTTEFLHWLRDPLPPDAGGKAPSAPWGGAIHLASCHVGAFTKEFLPEQCDPGSGERSPHPLWEQGNLFLYGSNKPIFHEVSKQNFDSLLRYLGECKRDSQSKPDAAEALRRVMMDSPETVALLGGACTEAIVSHAPKTLLEALPGYMQARWQQMVAHEKLKESLSSPVNYEAAAKKDGPSNDMPAGVPVMSHEKATWFFLTRVSHLKTSEKLELLKSDLHRYPWLVNVQAKEGTTPLMIIAERPFEHKGAAVNAVDIARILLDRGADINAQNSNGRTALYFAIREGNADLVRLLLSRGARIDLTDMDRRNALHSACLSTKNRSAVVNALLQTKGASLIDKRDRSGKTALHLAIASGNVDVVKALLAAGANPEKRTGSWESCTSLARRAHISHAATDEIVLLLKTAIADKKMPRRSGA
ncbi:MAG: ankyrin repeat domain-containing protein [Burkholderiaceae bacterium]|nr:ankyrin repeat domain-containing protein [Burkholderiaceae bacterium]